MTTIPRLANPPATAQVIRDLITGFRMTGAEVVLLDDLEAALDLLEANGWVLPRPPIETPGP